MVTPILSGFSASMCSPFTFDAAHACYLPLFTFFLFVSLLLFIVVVGADFAYGILTCFYGRIDSLLLGIDYYFHFRFQILFPNMVPLTRIFLHVKKGIHLYIIMMNTLSLRIPKVYLFAIGYITTKYSAAHFWLHFFIPLLTSGLTDAFLINLYRWWKFAGGIRGHGAAMVTVTDWATALMPDSIPTAPPTDQWAFDGIYRAHDFLDLLVHWVWDAVVLVHVAHGLCLHWPPFRTMHFPMVQCHCPRSLMLSLVERNRCDWVRLDYHVASHVVCRVLNRASDVCAFDCPNRRLNMPVNLTSIHCRSPQSPLRCSTHSNPFDR